MRHLPSRGTTEGSMYLKKLKQTRLLESMIMLPLTNRLTFIKMRG